MVLTKLFMLQGWRVCCLCSCVAHAAGTSCMLALCQSRGQRGAEGGRGEDAPACAG